MILKRLGLAGIVIGLGIGAAGCTDGYGYGGVGVGYASDPYYDGYGSGYYGAGYDGYGAGYGGYYGWYGDYYYPGTGVYVFDRNRRPYRWNDGQRRYWEGRRGGYRGNGVPGSNWDGFGRGNGVGVRPDYRQDRGGAGRDFRRDRRDDVGQSRGGQVTADPFRDQRRAARQQYYQNRGGGDGGGRPAFTGNRPNGANPAYRGGGGPRSGGDRGGGGWRGRQR